MRCNARKGDNTLAETGWNWVAAWMQVSGDWSPLFGGDEAAA
jgi:hypothetical protein